MTDHDDIVEILAETGQDFGYKVLVKGKERRRVIPTVTRKLGKRSIIGYDPDVIWEGDRDTAIFEVECGYGGGKQQKYIFGTIALSFLFSKSERKKTWFYIVVDNEKIGNQVFKFLHCINEYVADTHLKGDFARQVIVCSQKLLRNQLKDYLKRELRKEGW